MSIEAKLAEMNLTLPPPPPKGGVYQSLLVVGEQALFSGHVPVMPDGSMITGRVGDDVDLKAAQVAARQVGLCILATAKDRLGTLDRIKRVVKLFEENPSLASDCLGCSKDADSCQSPHGPRPLSAISARSCPSCLPPWRLSLLGFFSNCFALKLVHRNKQDCLTPKAKAFATEQCFTCYESFTFALGRNAFDRALRGGMRKACADSKRRDKQACPKPTTSQGSTGSRYGA